MSFSYINTGTQKFNDSQSMEEGLGYCTFNARIIILILTFIKTKIMNDNVSFAFTYYYIKLSFKN